jgi:AAA+ ATPase superfamily predicted ATPase
MRNQFVFSFNLLRMIDNQSSMMRFLLSMKTEKSNNFLNVKTTTSSSMKDKSVFEFSTFLSRNSTFNSRMMSFASFNSFNQSLYFSMNSSNFIIFLLYSFMTKMLSSRMFIHVLIKTFSSLFNQYFN